MLGIIRKKCRNCKDLFIPDPRNAKRQKYCVFSVGVRNSIFFIEQAVGGCHPDRTDAGPIPTDFSTLASRKRLRSFQCKINRWMQAELLCNSRASNLGDFFGPKCGVLEVLSSNRKD